MPKFTVVGEVTISVRVTVEARSKAEAKRKAEESPMQRFCHQCAHGDDDSWSTSGELDGEVTITSVEKD